MEATQNKRISLLQYFKCTVGGGDQIHHLHHQGQRTDVRGATGGYRVHNITILFNLGLLYAIRHGYVCRGEGGIRKGKVPRQMYFWVGSYGQPESINHSFDYHHV